MMPAGRDISNKKRKVAGLLVLVALFAGTAACLALAARPQPKTLGPPIAAVAPLKPLTLPTGIDANFLRQVESCLLPVAAAYGHTLRVTSGYRTVEEQDLVFRQGRSENGHIVTEVAGGRSLHNFGLAVDVADRSRGYDLDWDRLGRIGTYCGLEQNDEGDQAHFTHRDGLSIEGLAIGFRPRPLELPCPLLADRAAGGDQLTRQDLKDCGAPEF